MLEYSEWPLEICSSTTGNLHVSKITLIELYICSMLQFQNNQLFSPDLKTARSLGIYHHSSMTSVVLIWSTNYTLSNVALTSIALT